ncbi:MAG TPA: hypothetical protein VL051_09895, partial [Burkholderiaceae bacterium]|nr:hypothetical protein [Burkholderiaceae bacterium]
VVTEKSGQKVQSFELGRDGCVRNWLAHALNHPSATTIIIETVERVLLPRFRDLPECSPKTPQPFEIGAWTTATTRHTWPPEWHIYRTFEVSLNALEMQRNPASTIRSNMAVNAPIDSRCAKFSHRRPDRFLYYSQDEDKFQWQDGDLARAAANILQLQEAARARGKQFILIVVPDKLSVYRKCLLSKAFPAGSDRNVSASLIAAGVRSLDLLAAFQANANRITDLYLPNDTHLSTNGYILMGEKMAQFLSEKPL